MDRRLALATLAALALPLCAFAQAAFPSKPITIIVPATPGGAIDLAARLIGAKFTAAWGQPVSIENVGGAAGMLGSDRVAKATPDGYTLALVASSHAINPSMYKKLPFDTVKGFEPVMQTHSVPLVLVVSNSIPAKTLPELIAHLKADPGKYSFGFIVNVARGSVIEEAALVRALAEKRIAGAGLDVFEREPEVPRELFTLDNVVLLPHIASATRETRQAMADRVFDNLQSYFASGAPVSAAPLQ